MFGDLYNNIGLQSNVSVIIISISLMLFLGFLMTRITKLLKLPNVTAYIITGILIGPYFLNLIPQKVISGMDFITDISLAFIAFSVGKFFKLSLLKKNGIKVLIITLFETIISSLLVFVLMYNVLHLELTLSVLLSVLASCTSSASTVMTIRQTNSKGDFVDTLLQVVALDIVVGVIAYSVATSLVVANINNTFTISTIFNPILTNLLALVIGIVFGIFLKMIISEKRTTDNKLIVSIATLLFYCGICEILDLSPLLGCIAMGSVYINTTNDEKLFKQLNYFNPPILLLFFTLSGLKFDINLLFTSGNMGGISLFKIGIIYFITRLIGKYVGAYLGCRVAKKSDDISKYMGLALIPQAGVAIGLAALGSRIIGGDTGNSLNTIIVASSILYELIGPIGAKLALYLTKSYSNNIDEIVKVDTKNEDGTTKSNVEILIERIKKIDSKLPKTEQKLEEDAFDEAIEDYEENIIFRNNRFRRR